MKLPSSLSLVSSIALLFACTPVELSGEASYSVDTDLLVVRARSDSAQSLKAFAIAGADVPEGDYLAFASESLPVSTQQLAAFDPDVDCPSSGASCEVTGLGRYAGRSRLTANGTIDLQNLRLDYEGSGPSESYLIIARRSTVVGSKFSVTISAWSSGGDGGCGGAADDPTLERVADPLE